MSRIWLCTATTIAALSLAACRSTEPQPSTLGPTFPAQPAPGPAVHAPPAHGTVSGHLFSPRQSLQMRRADAQQFDPYPQPDIGPEVVGARPLSFDKPRAEATRAPWWKPSRWWPGR